MRGIVVVLVAVAGCGSQAAPPSQREVPVAKMEPVSCGSDAPTVCPDGCCAPSDSCGISGCDSAPVTPSCAPDSPVYCSSARAADDSPNAIDLTLAAPADFVLGRFGGGVSIECAQGSMCSPSITAATTIIAATASGITVEAWVRPTLFDGSVMAILDWKGVIFAITPDLSSSTFWWFAGGTEHALQGPALDDAWHFVAGTFTSPSTPPSFFLDGVPLAGSPSSMSSNLIDNAPGVIVGNRADGGYPFYGAIDEVRVLSTATGAAQIAADFAAPLTSISGTVALWHFDDPVDGWCCPTGATCGSDSGVCLGVTAGATTCPPAAPMQCPSGCCPAGSGCDASGSCDVTISPCPPSAPVDCHDGTCCASGYTCLSGSCVLDPPTPAPSPTCPSGTSLATNSPSFCCPSSTPATYAAGKCNGGGCSVGLPGQASGLCYSGYACSTTVPGTSGTCFATAVAATCPVPCNGGCCAGGQSCGASGCCPSGTTPCGAACCPSSQCTAGTCTTTPSPAGSCPGNTTPCGGDCCPAGSLCMSGSCVQVPQPATYCTRGIACGGQCCLGTSCSSTGACVQIVVPASSPCRAGCYGGRAASVGGGRSAPLVCHCNVQKPATPSCSDSKFPTACGSVCCVAGGSCTQNACHCPADHPLSCGASCCLSGASCTNGSCDCPMGRANCGAQCCDLGQACVDGACQAAASTTGGGGGNCDAFGQQYCNPTNGARCLNGHCQCCWATCGSGTGQCACNPCGAGCDARGFACSTDGTCIEPPPPEGPACSN